MDNQQRFELLSAYLDQELSPEEVEEVEQWLKQDHEARRTYHNLLQLRYRLREIPIPSSQLPSELLSYQVTQKAHAQRMRQWSLWGGSAIAALFVVILTSLFSTNHSSLFRIAQSDERSFSKDSLMIEVDQPIMEIPTAPAENN